MQIVEIKTNNQVISIKLNKLTVAYSAVAMSFKVFSFRSLLVWHSLHSHSSKHGNYKITIAHTLINKIKQSCDTSYDTPDNVNHTECASYDTFARKEQRKGCDRQVRHSKIARHLKISRTNSRLLWHCNLFCLSNYYYGLYYLAL